MDLTERLPFGMLANVTIMQNARQHGGLPIDESTLPNLLSDQYKAGLYVKKL